MSPAALALAVVMHASVGAALWWVSPLRPHDQTETAIMVTVEPEPGGGTQSTDAAPPVSLSDALPSNEPPQEAPQQALAPAEPMPVEPTLAEPTSIQPSPPEQAQPQPQPESQPTEAEAEASWPTDASSWKPQVTFEQSAPSPQAAATSRNIASAAPQRAVAAPQRAPSDSQGSASVPSAASGAPGPLMGLGGQRNDYLSRVFRHIEPFRSYPASARANRQSGRVVTRVTINRDGQLIDVRLDQSSGWPAIDDAELTAIRRAMPLPPVPHGMPGDPIVLILPMNYGIR
jgi:protein TonB